MWWGNLDHGERSVGQWLLLHLPMEIFGLLRRRRDLFNHTWNVLGYLQQGVFVGISGVPDVVEQGIAAPLVNFLAEPCPAPWAGFRALLQLRNHAPGSR